MQIQALYQPERNLLVTSYDNDAQKIFARAAKKTEMFRRKPSVIGVLKSHHPERLDDFATGSNLLRRLGTEPSRQVRLHPDDVRKSFHLACCASLSFAEKRLPLGGLKQALMLLSSITPIVLTKRSLPPTVEVFDQDKIPRPVWQTFEVIRSWPHPGSPILFVIQLHQLRFELIKIPPGNEQLDALSQELTQATRLFRETMKYLAKAEIDKPKTKGQKGSTK